MGKTIRFNENGLIAIKNRLNEITAGNDEVVSLNEARPECDVFYLGMEPGGGPGLYCHAKEKKKKKKKKKHKMNESKEVLQELKITNNAKFKKEHNHIFVIYRGNMLLSTYGGKREIFNFLVKSGFKADKLEQLAGNWWYNYGSDLHYLVNDIPYLIAGYIRKEAVYNRYLIQVIPNEGYDVLNSNEFYQFVRALPSLIGPINYKKCAIKVGNQEVDKNEIINNRGQQLPSTWYHGTRNIDALGAILGVGIRPTPEKSVYNVKHNDTVFVTSDLSLGEKYAKFKSNETYGTFPSPDYIAPCVLVVDGTKLDVNRVVFDFDVYGKYKNTRDDEIYNGIIDKTSAALGNANAFEKKGNFIDDTKNPMRFSKIGYRGVIHNNAIIGVIVDGKELSKEQFVELMKGKNVTLNPVKEDRQKANRLLEHHLDQRLPFDEPEYANKYYAEQYRDWLEEYGKYGTLPPSKLDFWEEVKKAITYIKENSIKGDRDVSLPKDLSEEEIFKRLKEGRIGPYLRVTNDGKIYVERAVKIDEDPTQFSENGKEELYDRLMRDYGNNVGGCWSYCLYGSRAYCGGRYRNRIVLRGYIRTDDIDYVNTILTNYNYDNQYEIRVKPFAQVQLFNFTYGKYTIRFRNNLIVSSTYFGNNSRFTGNACKIDDGFGNFTYVDRKNNVLTKEAYNNELNRYTDECLASGESLKGIFDEYYLSPKTGFALIGFGDKINYINPSGKRVSDIWYDGGSEFSENRARVKLDGKEAYIDENGRRICRWYDECSLFYEDIAVVRLGNKYTYINKEGKRINNDWYDYCNYFKGDFAIVRLDRKNTIINKNGDRICDWYDTCGEFYFGGFAKVTLGDKNNYVNTQGKEIFKNWYENCLPFENGYAPVKIDGKWTYVDQNESAMFEPRYDSLSLFTGDFGLAELRYRQAFIDINGDPISDWYDYIAPLENGFARAREKCQWTFINRNGKRINDIWYRNAEDFKEDGTARVRVAKKWSYIDQNGNEVRKEKNEVKENKKIIIPESKLDVIKESNIPQEFIDRARELMPNRFSNWAVINLNDVNLMPRYFEKKSKALEYYKWMKMEPKNKAVIVSLDESIDFKENKLGIITENSTDKRVNSIIAKYSGINNFDEIRKKRTEILRAVPNARAKNDMYLGAVAMYYLTGCLNSEYRFKINRLLAALNKGVNFGYRRILDNVDFNMTPFDKLKTILDRLITSEKSIEGYEGANKDEKIQRVGRYTIYRMDSYDDAKYLNENFRGLGIWCVFNEDKMFSDMFDGYTAYLCIRDGYKNAKEAEYDDLLEKLSVLNMNDVVEMIEEEYPKDEVDPDFLWDIANDGYDKLCDALFKVDSYKLGLPPCDDYGLSMMVVMVSNNENTFGSLGCVYSRYNLPNAYDGDALDENELSEVIGAPYQSVFKPYKNEEVEEESKKSKKIIIPENKLAAIKENIESEVASSDNRYEELFSIWNTNRDLSYYDEAISYFKNICKQTDEEMCRISNKYGKERSFFIINVLRMGLQVDPNDLKRFKELSSKYNDTYDKVKKLEARKESIIQYEEEYKRAEKLRKQREKNDKVFYLAIDDIGTTDNFGQAGYILPDGSMLNLGCYGMRDTDHNIIQSVYEDNKIRIRNANSPSDYVADFVSRGAIRCCLIGGLLEMVKEPTNEQYSVIKAFVRYLPDKYLNIDFSNKKGSPQHSVSYSAPKPQMVVSDIYKYYNEGIKPIGNISYESKENEGTIVENIEPEVASSEVDLSSFRKRDTLPPKIWKDEDTLDSRVRLKLLDIADDFWEFVNLTWVEPKGIIMTGSMCNFNWSEFSDIDLHLIVDFNEVDEKKEFVKQYLDSKKDEWNDRHEDLKIMGFPVELYVQDVDDSLEAGGIYDLEENAWTRKPNSGSIKSIGLDKFSIKDKAAEIMTIIDDMYNMLSNTDDSHKIEEIGDDAHYLWDKVKDLRKKSLDKHGESGPGNIVYKVLRRTGYLDKLFKLFSKVYDRSNSISENVKKYLAVLKEEVAMDGSSEGNPYAERWKEERDALKNFIANYGKLMQSKEDNKMGKLYKVYYDKTMSELIGYNYCICVQWDEIEMKPGSTVYIRALDKFTPFIRRNLQFDDRGRDNVRGNYDDMRY